MTPRLLLAAAVLAWTSPLYAQFPGWTEDIKPTDYWTKVVFWDESGTKRTYFARRDGIPADDGKVDSGEKPTNVQLFMFPTVPAPTVKDVDLKEGGGPNQTYKVLTFKDIRGTEYVVAARWHAGLKISRSDRPDVAFFGYANEDWHTDPGYYSADGIAPSDWKAAAEAKKLRRVITLRPTGIDTAPNGPLTGDPETGLCASLVQMLATPASVGHYQIKSAATLAEMEFSYGAKRFGAYRWDQFMTMPTTVFEQTGSYGPPNAALPGYRAAVKLDAEQVIKEGAAGKEDRLTPYESRFLRCRMISSGLDDQLLKQADAASGDEAKAKAFTKFWRAFVADELNRMVAEGATAPALPSVPDHKKANAEQTQRAKDALAGKGSFVPKPEPVKKDVAKADPPKADNPPPQKAKIAPKKPLPNAEDVFK